MHTFHIFDRLEYDVEKEIDYLSDEPIGYEILYDSIKQDLKDLYQTPPFDYDSFLHHIINLFLLFIISFIRRNIAGCIYLKEVSLIPIGFYDSVINSHSDYKVGFTHPKEPDVMYTIEGRGIYSPYRGKQFLIDSTTVHYLRRHMGVEYNMLKPLIIEVCPAGAPLHGTYIISKINNVYIKYTHKHAHFSIKHGNFKKSNFTIKSNTRFNCCSCQAFRIDRRRNMNEYEYVETINYVHKYVRKQPSN
jgi:hypothetical protein